MSTELKAEVERLYAANNRLARQLAGMSAKLEEGRRELLATGWDACAERLIEEPNRIAPAYLLGIRADNPYRKPVIDLTGAIICKTGEGQ
jgi:hypothetical protein